MTNDRTHPRLCRDRGFTLVELLVTIGIIVVLVGLLVPVVGKVRLAAQEASTKNFISQIASACENYQLTFRAYPGPLSNDQVNAAGSGATAPVITGVPMPGQITGTENCVLGLLGGIQATTGSGGAVTYTYDPALVGVGPNSLNPRQPKRYPAFIDAKYLSSATGPKTGHFGGEFGEANDTIIPEFVDQFPNALPILYLRARTGAVANGTRNATNNSVITESSASSQYTLGQITGYTAALPSQGLKTLGFATPFVPLDPKVMPYDAYGYFASPASVAGATPDQTLARQKDSFILISAGKDRVYGTPDDITNFGSVLP